MQDKPVQFLKSESNFLNIQKPTFCCLEISPICILRCKMCFVWKNKCGRSSDAPMLNEWYNFIDLLADLSNKSIIMNFSGAEPLVDERNLALISFSAKRGLFTSMCTNGFLIDKEMANKIADSGLDTIIISLDGINKDTHDFLRGTEGCYDKVKQAIGYLDRYCSDLKIGIQTIILERNLDEIIRLVEWVNDDNRIEFINFQAVVQPFDILFDDEWYKKSEYDFLWPKDVEKTHAVIGELISLKNAGYKITNSISQLEVFKRYFGSPQKFVRKDKCNVDFWMSIDRFGNVYMCRLKEPIGNIKRDHPKDLWYSKEANQRREEIKNFRVNCHLLINCSYEKK